MTAKVTDKRTVKKPAKPAYSPHRLTLSISRGRLNNPYLDLNKLYLDETENPVADCQTNLTDQK